MTYSSYRQNSHCMIAILAALLVATPSAYCAAVTSVGFFTSTSVLGDHSGTRLSGGNPTVDHDGTVVQLGYHSAATVGNEFAGTWIPLTGEGQCQHGVFCEYDWRQLAK